MSSTLLTISIIFLVIMIIEGFQVEYRKLFPLRWRKWERRITAESQEGSYCPRSITWLKEKADENNGIKRILINCVYTVFAIGVMSFSFVIYPIVFMIPQFTWWMIRFKSGPFRTLRLMGLSTTFCVLIYYKRR